MKKNLLITMTVLLSTYNMSYSMGMQSKITARAVDIAARSAHRVLRNLTLFSAGTLTTAGYLIHNKLIALPNEVTQPKEIITIQEHLKKLSEQLQNKSRDYKGLLIVGGIGSLTIAGHYVDKYMKNKNKPKVKQNQSPSAKAKPNTSNEEAIANALKAQPTANVVVAGRHARRRTLH